MEDNSRLFVASNEDELIRYKSTELQAALGLGAYNRF